MTLVPQVDVAAETNRVFRQIINHFMTRKILPTLTARMTTLVDDGYYFMTPNSYPVKDEWDELNATISVDKQASQYLEYLNHSQEVLNTDRVVRLSTSLLKSEITELRHLLEL